MKFITNQNTSKTVYLPLPFPVSNPFRFNRGALFIGLLTVVSFFVSSCGLFSSAVDEAQYKKKWATPLHEDTLPNLHKVDDGLYRGAAPKKGGFKILKKMGVKTVINFRSKTDEQKQVEAAGLSYVALPQWTKELDERNYIEFLKTVTDPSKRPVFVHCRHGVDRTGINVALYRIIVQNWSKQDAIEEMRAIGSHFLLWTELEDYINAVDPQELAQKAGLTPGPKSAKKNRQK